jgi:hypothetical protein
MHAGFEIFKICVSAGPPGQNPQGGDYARYDDCSCHGHTLLGLKNADHIGLSDPVYWRGREKIGTTKKGTDFGALFLWLGLVLTHQANKSKRIDFWG